MAGILFPADAVSGAPSYTGQMARAALSAVMGGRKGARPLGARSGVAAGTPASIVTASSTTWTVQPFAGFLDLETSATAGAALFAFLAAETGAMNPASGSNQRVDSLFVRQDDPSQSDGTAAPLAAVQYVAGTAGASGGARGAAGGPPNFPNARCFELAQITVPISGGGSPVVNFVAPFVAAAGGVIPTHGASDYPTSPYVGQVIDDGVLLRWNGSNWAPVGGGVVASSSFSTNLVSSGGTEGVGYSQAANLVAGRRYRVWFRAWLNATAGNRATIRIRYSTGTVTSASTPADSSVSFYIPATGAAGRDTGLGYVEFVAPTTDLYNVAMTVATTVGSGDTTVVGTEQATRISIDDLGS